MSSFTSTAIQSLEIRGKRVRLPKYILLNFYVLNFFLFFITDWTGIIPSYDKIPAGLLQVLKDPFPFPSPAPLPPSDIGYARPIPQEIQNILATVSLITSTSKDKGKGKSTEVSSPSPPAPPPNVDSSCSLNQASTSAQSLFTPYEPPSHYSAHVEALKARSLADQQEHVARELPQVKKMDPYEEGK